MRRLPRPTAYGWAVPAARVFLVADVMAGIAGALDELVPAGTPVVLSDAVVPAALRGDRAQRAPGRAGAAAARRRPAGARSTSTRIDAAFAAGARSLLLCSPHNPTGRVFTRRRARARSPRSSSGTAPRVIADEVHAPLVYPGHRARPVREHLRRDRRAHGHGHVRLEGVQPRRVEVRAGRHLEPRRRGAVAEAPGVEGRGPDPDRDRRVDRGVPVRRAVAGRARRRTWTGTGSCSRELIDAEVPGVTLRPPEGTFLSWLDCSGLEVDDPAELLPPRGTRRGLRRAAVRRGRGAARPVQLRDVARAARADRPRDGRRGQRPLISASVGHPRREVHVGRRLLVLPDVRRDRHRRRGRRCRTRGSRSRT